MSSAPELSAMNRRAATSLADKTCAVAARSDSSNRHLSPPRRVASYAHAAATSLLHDMKSYTRLCVDAPTICGVTRDEYRVRIGRLRTLLAVFRGPLECTEVGGSAANISERDVDGKEYHVGGAVTSQEAMAIVEAVNFVRDLCARKE